MKYCVYLLLTFCSLLHCDTLRPDKLYILNARSGEITVKDPVLSLYTLSLDLVRQQVAELPPIREHKHFTLSTGALFAQLKSLPVTSYRSRLSFQTEKAEQRVINFFEIYTPTYDPLKKTVTLDFQVFVGGKLAPQKLYDPAVFFYVEYIPIQQERP